MDSSELTCIKLHQPPTAWVIRRQEPSSAVETLIGYIRMLAPFLHDTLHHIRCPLSSFTIIMVRVFDTESTILSGRPFRIDSNMSFSASMGAPGKAGLMNRSLQVQLDGSRSWRKRLIRMVFPSEEGSLHFGLLTKWTSNNSSARRRP